MRPRADDAFLDGAEPRQPVEADWAECAARKGERLDDGSGVCSPQPGPAGHDGIFDRERQRAAGERQAIGQQPRTQFGEEIFMAWRGMGLVHQPSEGRW